jgi:hypothetical protein
MPDPDRLTIITNHQARAIIDASQLAPNERSEFDYLNWDAIEEGRDSASFIRYRGQLYDLGEFQATRPSLVEWNPLRAWDSYLSDSYFSGIVIRYIRYDEVIVGRYYS